MSRPLQCPTRVFSDRAYVDAVRDLVGDRRWTLVTSAGWRRRGCVDDLRRRVGDPVAVIDAVPPNPKVSDLESLSNDMAQCDIVVALGGGSVIDAAKGLVGLQALDGDMSILMAHLREGAALPDTLAPVPLIAVPTTSGTGSEVTRWATVWGDDRVKFSLQHPTLYPSDAILDPVLCTSMPEDLTLATGLDALSHAMEAVWNRNSTPLSDRMATTAIEILFAFLAPTLATPADVELRRHIQIASLIAGLAMGTTQTALAHSISYPFTAHFGMPHGFACSFTLPEVVRYNIVENSSKLAPVAAGLDCGIEAIADTLDAWFDALGVARHVLGYVAPEVTDQFGDDLITRARAANNMRDIAGLEARAIARRSLDRLSGASSAGE